MATKKSVESRLVSLAEVAKLEANDLVSRFENNWRGKVMFSLVLAQSVRTLCSITSGLHENAFIRDVKKAARIWEESGEP